jgi:hypothetical protein
MRMHVVRAHPARSRIIIILNLTFDHLRGQVGNVLNDVLVGVEVFERGRAALLLHRGRRQRIVHVGEWIIVLHPGQRLEATL